MAILQICIEVLCGRGEQRLGEKRREVVPGRVEMREGICSKCLRSFPDVRWFLEIALKQTGNLSANCCAKAKHRLCGVRSERMPPTQIDPYFLVVPREK